MTAGLWILPVVLLTGSPPAQVPAGCEKKCEKKYVPCSDGRAEAQMMCFEVVRRCELKCKEPSARAAKATAATKPRPKVQGRRR